METRFLATEESVRDVLLLCFGVMTPVREGVLGLSSQGGCCGKEQGPQTF